jgi:hypothetical protein
MASANFFPKDLAKTLYSKLRKHQGTYPDLRILTELLETLYFVSLKTEEQQPITCYIIYLSCENPDPKPPERIKKDRWSYIRFEEPILLTTSNLVKLAKASDPRTSSFAVYHNADGHPIIWGLVDQGNQYHDFINYEKESGADRPGIFQVSVVGLGHLVTYIGYDKIAELKANVLIDKTLDVLWKGPINETLRPSILKYVKKIHNEIPREIYGERDHWNASLVSYWIYSLCRLLLRVQNYRHGGAFLITPESSLKGLNVKYRIEYDRLRRSIEELALTIIEKTYAEDQIFEHYLDLDSNIVPADLYLDEVVNSAELEDIRDELDSTIWFISLLTRVDGLVLMNPNLEVLGFGVEIIDSREPEKVYQATSENATKTRLHEINYFHFGTRHRSMMRYCSHTPGSVGVVISQDGDVRAMTLVRGQLVVWENIRLQRQFILQPADEEEVIST